MRLNRFLAASGLGSRRSCEELVRAGRVTINGRVAENLATEVSGEDFVKLGGKRVMPEKRLYILLHKPRGFLSTAADTHDRRTIFDLLPANWPRVFHVGRLDRDSEGLLILTNDGDLSLHLTHPRYKIEKEYEVLLDRPYDAAAGTPKLLHGVNIEGGRARADAVKQIAPNGIRIVLRQGLKRQIRLMLYKVGYEVERLIRTRIGPLRLTDLRPGEWRFLTEVEVKMLQAKPAGAEEPAKRKTPSNSHEKPRARETSPARARGRFPGGNRSAGEERHSGAPFRPGTKKSPAKRPAGRPNGRPGAASTPRAGGRP